jgi:hypothetical protein
MAATTISRRGTKAAAAERAAKERRQLFVVIGLAVLLVIVLVFELPKILGRGNSNAVPVSTVSTGAPTTGTLPPAAATPTAPGVTPSASAGDSRAYRRALRKPANDPFTGSVTPTPDAIGGGAAPAGLHDPFGSPSAPSRIVTASPTTTVTGPAIKGTIVIGKPGAGMVAEHGWIVILASIPTGSHLVRRQGEACGRRLARDPELVEESPASWWLLGRLFGAVHDLGRGQPECRRRARQGLRLGLHPAADRLQEEGLEAWPSSLTTRSTPRVP